MKTQESIDEKTILSLLDIVGSCITDIFYNHLFDRAISIHEKTSNGLTESYRQTIKEYVNESNTPKFYSVLLNSIHHYTRMTTVYNTISYTDCITIYAGLFVPQMYINSLTIEQKVNIVSMIFGNVVKDFADEILENHISIIIDDHSDPINIEILQDAILKILLNERDISYDRFIESQKPQKTTKQSKKVKIDKTSNFQTKAMSKITDAFKKSIEERSLLKKKNLGLQQKNKTLTKNFQEIKNMFLQQISHQKEQATLIIQLKEKIHQLTQENLIKPHVETTQMYEKKEDEDEDEDDYGLFSVTYVES